MANKILFGTIEMYNTKTGQRETSPATVYTEGEPMEKHKNHILRNKPHNERQYYKLLKYNSETATFLGYTNHTANV